ncbi:ABC transporter ATP-binding protein [Clostridium cylindrosporum]|uniref:Nod factor export ATP-binding protein I n=1 Tax=Clostridium cylindrosporum DSM 605 TaxID=1121307 RepID=A0A0J8G3U3_CLOCY|nr:ATP-binding cassette domain-containing protein [Clostridium cylindrosporum]KMT22381.1 Nod factor export ATP-binding protein I [Clostridium cylindrosporum DSM 605]
MNKIIEVNKLKKSFKDVQAVKGLDFYVEAGGLFAFLGPNGAGKSTTIDIISTLLQPDSGNITIDGYTLGKDDDKIRSIIGIVFQDSLLDPLLTVRENISLRGRFYGLSKSELTLAVEKASTAAGVVEFLDRPYGKLSGGQRRRADIARALINTPKILFLDEPTTGLDPQTRQNVWETIEKLQRENGMTIFLTTHYMEEAANADYVIVIDNGLISAKGTPMELKINYSSDNLKIKPRDFNLLQSTLDSEKISYKIISDVFVIPLKSTLESIPIIKKLENNIDSFEVVSGSMDDVFINITGKEIRG